jgi:hypothetical protein
VRTDYVSDGDYGDDDHDQANPIDYGVLEEETVGDDVQNRPRRDGDHCRCGGAVDTEDTDDRNDRHGGDDDDPHDGTEHPHRDDHSDDEHDNHR